MTTKRNAFQEAEKASKKSRPGAGGSGQLPAEDRQPGVTVAIASFREPELLDACLASVRGEAAAQGAQVLVARAGSAAELAALRRRYPWARFLQAALGTNVPRLRGLALGAASTEVVALTEDHCVVEPQWLERLLGALRDGVDIVGGSMGNARRHRALDWGAYFAEYGFFADRAARAGDKVFPTGANVLYRWAVAREVGRWASAGLWENVAHERLARRGLVFVFEPEARVLQNGSYRFWAFCLDRFRHGRDYACRRLLEEESARRWLYVVGAPLLPVVLTTRVGRRAAAGRKAIFLRALPFTLAFLTAWSAGEAIGYTRGGLQPAGSQEGDDDSDGVSAIHAPPGRIR